MLAHLKQQVYLALKEMKGSRYRHNLNWLMKNQYLPYEAQLAEQEVLLKRLLKEAVTWTDGYRERLIDAGVYRNGRFNLSRFHHIPPLLRTDLIFNAKAFTHGEAEAMGLYYHSTGGSSGTAVNIGHNHEYHDWFLAGQSLFYSWSGLTVGTPYFFLWPASRDLHAQMYTWQKQLVVGFLQGRRILNCRVTSEDLYAGFVDRINREKDCNYMVGYTGELYALACLCLDRGLKLNRRFKAVYATAEKLTEPMRVAIEEVFGCKVYNRYGCRDAGDLACECEHQQGLHINPLYAVLEVADDEGSPLPDGIEGNILITSLHNTVMPLIRYSVGDRGILKAPALCACGREWPTLVSPPDRTTDKLILPTGAQFGGPFLHCYFDHLKRLRRYQVHQIGPTELFIKLRSPVPDYVNVYRADLDEVTHRLSICSGVDWTIHYEQTDDFDKTPTGKERIIVQHLDHVPLLPVESETAKLPS